MASVVRRFARKRIGTDAQGKPIWKRTGQVLYYGKYRERDGKWRMAPTHQPTRALAKRWIDAVESRVAQGKVGIELPCTGGTFEKNMGQDVFQIGIENDLLRSDSTQLRLAQLGARRCPR